MYNKIRNDSFRTLATDQEFLDKVGEEKLVRCLEAFVWRQLGPPSRLCSSRSGSEISEPAVHHRLGSSDSLSVGRRPACPLCSGAERPRCAIFIRHAQSARSLRLLHCFHRISSSSLRPAYTRRRARRPTGMFPVSRRRRADALGEAKLTLPPPPTSCPARRTARRPLSRMPRSGTVQSSLPVQLDCRDLRFPSRAHFLGCDSTPARGPRAVGFPTRMGTGTQCALRCRATARDAGRSAAE